MAGLLDSCRELFGTDDLYKVLKVKPNASSQEVKKGYHKQSLLVHPDRVKESEKKVATKKFQVLGKVYTILSDKDKRAIYNETGDVDDETDLQEEKDWYDYWRLLFAKISVKDIQDYEKKYKGSKEELKDLKAAYIESEGDMDHILNSVLCASIDDEERFRGILTNLIKDKKVPDFKAFTKESKSKKSNRKKEAAEEAAEAEKAAKKLGLNGGADSLQALIQKKQESRAAAFDNFFAQMEAKYADCEPEPKKVKASPSKKKAKSKSAR